jgi:hypothetical protein
LDYFTLRTPVAFLIFNRPETTARVFAEIARARPPKLLVVADGPRAARPAEAEACRATRAVVERVDWDCEVLTNYADENLGCRRRVSTGLEWIFREVEEAIILEDDCLPHPSFFPFCEELLERYRADERVMMISGDNFQRGRRRTSFSYYFSRYTHIWGWASWRRAWQHYDLEIKHWEALRRETLWLRDILGDETAARYWQTIFDQVFDGHATTWDYQWLFACWAQNGLSITPEINLISNIGFGANSTHTATPDETVANLPAGEMLFPLRHPPFVVRAREADDFESEFVFKCGAGDQDWIARARRKLSAMRS